MFIFYFVGVRWCSGSTLHGLSNSRSGNANYCISSIHILQLCNDWGGNICGMEDLDNCTLPHSIFGLCRDIMVGKAQASFYG